ncbi:MAG: LytTR family DNA-binding domain-containing protein [Gammaproteobacteria bacterium]|nr:LytTR family DNA-binding domain-containing protein [Gammaproteobacteria bacterium]
MKVLVVDDEPPARNRLGQLVAELRPNADVAEAVNGVEALAMVERTAPDVVLLDVRMPGMDGLEVARRLANEPGAPAVIFTTAYDAHAVAAFDAEALDYLLKPVRKSRLERALARVAARGSQAQMSEGDGAQGRTHLSATHAGRTELIPINDIRFLRADQKYVEAATPDGTYLVDESLTSLEAEYSARFLRVHRGALVARGYVRSLARDDNGQNVVLLDGVEQPIEVSRRLLPRVRELFKS